MKPKFSSPKELFSLLAELRSARRISKRDYSRFRAQLLAGEAQAVNVELYRKERISSRRFNALERAIARDRELVAAAKAMKQAA